ncbi:unnamed protein product [Lepeophtheirus salmonis]|uniref:(salmon louse) hypothetical protein n=1 Tax=Lepeophtheirus salmonis TaxID=72036 RepID=A0A7R8H0X4_LEPSM|nr:unnamed protein product [Lepeophtheirus salmonis]CAF2797584.1 unnamed protein product [Lepeophtheirus salmonis]
MQGYEDLSVGGIYSLQCKVSQELLVVCERACPNCILYRSIHHLWIIMERGTVTFIALLRNYIVKDKKSEGEEGESMFDSIIDLFFMPVTIAIGVLGNSLSIVVLRNKEIQLRDSFARILIALAVFDLTLILSSACIFTIPCFSDTYAKLLYPHIVPFFLPAAQIAMTASVYTTVITCFDRYIAICRPALLGCCGRSEQKTSWCLICGTAIFSIVYNFTRFFEFRPELTIDPSTNLTVFSVEQTALRKDPLYIQWYILIANFVFMGVFPSIIMIVFNLLVVRAVNEANKKRARMTKRQQRNITVRPCWSLLSCSFSFAILLNLSSLSMKYGSLLFLSRRELAPMGSIPHKTKPLASNSKLIIKYSHLCA